MQTNPLEVQLAAPAIDCKCDRHSLARIAGLPILYTAGSRDIAPLSPP